MIELSKFERILKLFFQRTVSFGLLSVDIGSIGFQQIVKVEGGWVSDVFPENIELSVIGLNVLAESDTVLLDKIEVGVKAPCLFGLDDGRRVIVNFYNDVGRTVRHFRQVLI